MDQTKNNFLSYLEDLGVHPKTLKNYKSDLKHFTTWLIRKVRTWGASADNLSEAVPYLSSALAVEYKRYLSQTQVPFKTINRRLSTIRHLSKFLMSHKLITSDFAQGLSNIVPGRPIKKITPAPASVHKIDYMLEAYAKYLEQEKLSHNTIKNYLSDIKHFSNWLKSQ